MTSHGPGYIDRSRERIVGIQTEANTTLELFGEFLDSAAELESPHQIRMLMERLHHHIAVSVADAAGAPQPGVRRPQTLARTAFAQEETNVVELDAA